MNIRFVYNDFFVQKASSQDDGKGNETSFTEEDVHLVVMKISKRLKKSD
jgi:hypothetical protein